MSDRRICTSSSSAVHGCHNEIYNDHASVEIHGLRSLRYNPSSLLAGMGESNSQSTMATQWNCRYLLMLLRISRPVYTANFPKNIGVALL